MTRKQAKQAGGEVWKAWSDGYKFMQGYANRVLTREDFVWLMSKDLLDANSADTGGWPTSWFWGRVAATKNILKKGSYAK